MQFIFVLLLSLLAPLFCFNERGYAQSAESVNPYQWAEPQSWSPGDLLSSLLQFNQSLSSDPTRVYSIADVAESLIQNSLLTYIPDFEHRTVSSLAKIDMLLERYPAEVLKLDYRITMVILLGASANSLAQLKSYIKESATPDKGHQQLVDICDLVLTVFELDKYGAKVRDSFVSLIFTLTVFCAAAIFVTDRGTLLAIDPKDLPIIKGFAMGIGGFYGLGMVFYFAKYDQFQATRTVLSNKLIEQASSLRETHGIRSEVIAPLLRATSAKWCEASMFIGDALQTLKSKETVE